MKYDYQGLEDTCNDILDEVAAQYDDFYQGINEQVNNHELSWRHYLALELVSLHNTREAENIVAELHPNGFSCIGEFACAIAREKLIERCTERHTERLTAMDFIDDQLP